MGKVAVIKTKETEASVEDFIASVSDEQKRKDSQAILKMMKKATGDKPRLWGASLIGFGNVRYKSATSGREVDWFKIGFSPRKGNISLYLILESKARETFLKKLGKHKTAGGCIYINKLGDVDTKVLEEMLKASSKKETTETLGKAKPKKK